MAVMAGVLDETQRRTLEAVCDTFVPAVEYDGGDEAHERLHARSAADMGVAAQIEGLMAQAMMPEDIAALGRLLDALAANDFASLPLEARTAVLHAGGGLGPRGQARREDAEEPHAPVLLRAARRARAATRTGRRSATRGRSPRRHPPSEAPKTIAVEQVSGADGDDRGRRLRGRLGRRRRRVRRRAADGRQVGAWCSSWAPTATSGLQAARAAGLLELYLARRPARARRTVDLRARRLDARRRHGRQLHELHPHARAHPARSGREHGVEGIDEPGYEAHIDAVWERLAVNDTRRRRRTARTEDDRGARGARLPLEDAHAQRRRECDDPQRLRLLLHGLPARLQAVDDEDLPAGRRRRRRALRGGRPRRADPRRGRPRNRRRGDRDARGRLRRPALDGGGADGRRGGGRRSSRRRCCCAAASAALPPASTCACIPRAWSAASTRSRSRAGSGRPSRRSRTSSPSWRASGAS